MTGRRAKPKRVKTSRYALNQNKFLTPGETDRLTLVLKRELATDRMRDAILLLLALRTGARATELLRLSRSDVHGQFVLIKGIKGSNDREVPIPQWLALALKAYLQALEGDFLFPISYARLRQIWLWYRPAKKCFHSLRHTFAITVYQRTHDIKLLQTALGHRQISNTLIYVDYVYSRNELKRIVF